MVKVEAKKDEAYHKKVLLNLMSERLSSHSYNRWQISNAYEYFMSDDYKDPFEALISHMEVKPDGKADQGAQIPYIYAQFKKVRTKVKSLEGELISLGFDMVVRSINQEAEFERQKIYKEKLRIKKREAERLVLAEQSGIPLGLDESLPESIDDLEFYIQTSYKSQQDKAMTFALKNAVKIYRYKQIRLQLFRDVLISGSCYTDIEVYDGIVYPRRINPFFAIPDVHMNSDDQHSSMAAFLEARYMTLPEIAEKYDVPEKDLNRLKEVYDLSKAGREDWLWEGIQDNFGELVYEPFVGQTLFNEGTMVPRALVVTAQWLDFEKMSAISKPNKDGIDRLFTYYGDSKNARITKNEEKRGASMESDYREVVRTATLIAGNIFVEWGVKENRITYVDRPKKAELSVTGYSPYLTQGKNISFVDEIRVLESYRNFLITKLQHQIAIAGGNGVAIDIAGLDEKVYGMGKDVMEEAMSSYKGYGVLLFDSTKVSMPQGYKPMQEIKGGIANEIEGYLKLLLWVDKEIEEKSGVTAIQQGQTHQGQLIGVTEYALQQGAKITMGLIRGFLDFESRTWGKVAEVTKIMMAAYPEVYEPIVGTQLLEAAVQDLDMHLRDYGAIIQPTSLGYDVDPELKELLFASVQQGGLLPHEALPILIQSKYDIHGAIDRYQKAMIRRHREMQQQAQQEQQALLEAQQQNNDANIAAQKERDESKAAVDLQRGQIAADSNRDVAAIQADQNNRSQIRDIMAEANQPRPAKPNKKT